MVFPLKDSKLMVKMYESIYFVLRHKFNLTLKEIKFKEPSQIIEDPT